MELFCKVLEHKITVKGVGFWNKSTVDCCQQMAISPEVMAKHVFAKAWK